MAPGIPTPSLANRKAKVVIIGGGAGGATAAKYVAKNTSGIQVTLIESSKTYASCFNSNLFIGHLGSFESLFHNYDVLIAKYGINVVFQRAVSIDRDRKRVGLDDGGVVEYDRLIISPGVELNYASVTGWGREHENLMPHAWQGGAQIALLKKKLDAVEDGGLIVMIAPPNPYCCPPGPYERVSMMARSLKESHRQNCKIIILDPKERFSMQGLFQDSWESLYPGMVEWIDANIYTSIERVDPATSTVVTGFETYKNAALVNVIPAQSAGTIARNSGLTNETGYCPIDPASMRSINDPNIYVIGDACVGGDMPKSAFAANGQAKIAASALHEELLGSKAPLARLESVCWSTIDKGNAIKVTGSYRASDGGIALLENSVSQFEDSTNLRETNQAEKLAWYEAITADMFG